MAVRDMGRSESAREIRGSLTKRLFVQSLAERKDSGRNMHSVLLIGTKEALGSGEEDRDRERRYKQGSRAGS